MSSSPRSAYFALLLLRVTIIVTQEEFEFERTQLRTRREGPVLVPHTLAALLLLIAQGYEANLPF